MLQKPQQLLTLLSTTLLSGSGLKACLAKVDSAFYIKFAITDVIWVRLSQIATISDIAKFSVLAGAISSCGSYVTIVSGLPEWSVKVFQVSTATCFIEQSIEPTEEQILHFSHCPNDWRQLALVSKSSASLISIELGISIFSFFTTV